MRKLLPLSIAALLTLFAFAAPAPAVTLPEVFAAPTGEELDEFDTDGEIEFGDEEDESATSEEDCEFAEEDCEEAEETEECILEDATAKVTPRPSDVSVLLTIRYRAFSPATVAIDAKLTGARGRLRLGANHAHFRRAGVFRDNFLLGEREMERALGAREFEVELRALNTPRYCRLDLNGAPRRAKRSLRADAPGRSGDRGRTRGR